MKLFFLQSFASKPFLSVQNIPSTLQLPGFKQLSTTCWGSPTYRAKLSQSQASSYEQSVSIVSQNGTTLPLTAEVNPNSTHLCQAATYPVQDSVRVSVLAFRKYDEHAQTGRIFNTPPALIYEYHHYATTCPFLLAAFVLVGDL